MDTEKNWFYYNENIRSESKRIIDNYAKRYLEPELIDFPELSNKIFIKLDNYGFVYHYFPNLRITLNKKKIEAFPYNRARFITAHILMSFELYINNLLFTNSQAKNYSDLKASFFALSKGYSYDFLKTFQTDCTRGYCDYKYKFCNIKCKNLFNIPCTCLTDGDIIELSNKLNLETKKYNLQDIYDFEKVLNDICCMSNNCL